MIDCSFTTFSYLYSILNLIHLVFVVINQLNIKLFLIANILFYCCLYLHSLFKQMFTQNMCICFCVFSISIKDKLKGRRKLNNEVIKFYHHRSEALWNFESIFKIELACSERECTTVNVDMLFIIVFERMHLKYWLSIACYIIFHKFHVRNVWKCVIFSLQNYKIGGTRTIMCSYNVCAADVKYASFTDRKIGTIATTIPKPMNHHLLSIYSQ